MGAGSTILGATNEDGPGRCSQHQPEPDGHPRMSRRPAFVNDTSFIPPANNQHSPIFVTECMATRSSEPGVR